MALNEATAHELRPRLQQREVTARELVQATLDRIDAVDGQINAFISIDAEGALTHADEIDRRRVKNEPLGPLAGIPLALKDVLCVQEGRTTCGSKILEHYIAPYDATAVAQLRAADAIIIGKTNMDEFAMGSSCENSYFGPTLNPRDPERVPGGSSGGSAAAVAADETILALGTDTGGSVRQPAGYCGVVGLKPTYGRVSRYGLVAYASSLDQIGPVSKDVEDTALLLQAIAGHDPRDSTSIDLPVPDYLAGLKDGIKGLKVGLAQEHFPAGLDAAVATAAQSAAATLANAGAELVDVQLPVAGHPEYCIGTYYLIAMGEASANLTRYDGVKYGHRAEGDLNLQEMYLRTRSEGFGEEVKRRIMLGTYALSAGYYDAYYRKAQQVRTLIRQDFEKAFTTCDILLSPVAPTTAFRLGEQTDDPLQMYLNDIYTASVNLALQTSGTSSYQLLAPPLEEAKLLRMAYALERTTA